MLLKEISWQFQNNIQGNNFQQLVRSLPGPSLLYNHESATEMYLVIASPEGLGNKNQHGEKLLYGVSCFQPSIEEG